MGSAFRLNGFAVLPKRLRRTNPATALAFRGCAKRHDERVRVRAVRQGCPSHSPAQGKEAMGFPRFLLRGLEQVEGEWALVTLAYNRKRLHNLRLA